MKVQVSLNLHWPISSAARSLNLKLFPTATSKLDRGQTKEICYCAFQTTRTLKFKSRLHNYVFRCRQSLLRSRATNLETQKHTERMEIHQSQTMTFWARWSTLLFPKRSALIDGSEKANVSWLLNFRISRVYEKRSKTEESTLEQWLALSVSVWQFINMLNKIVATLLKLFSGFKTGTMHLSAPFIKITLFELEAYHFK